MAQVFFVPQCSPFSILVMLKGIELWQPIACEQLMQSSTELSFLLHVYSPGFFVQFMRVSVIRKTTVNVLTSLVKLLKNILLKEYIHKIKPMVNEKYKLKYALINNILGIWTTHVVQVVNASRIT